MPIRLATRRPRPLTAFLLPTLALAQSSPPWPTRPVTMVVPFAAGGPMDVVGRIMATSPQRAARPEDRVENVGGAGGMTGAARVANAQPDGCHAARHCRNPGAARRCTITRLAMSPPISRRSRCSPTSRSSWLRAPISPPTI